MAVPGISDSRQLKSPSLKACQTFRSYMSLLSFKRSISVRYTADQRLYLILSKLVKSLISASKDNKYKSQCRERTASMNVKSHFTSSHQELKCFVFLSFLNCNLNLFSQLHIIQLCVESCP